MSEVAVYFLCVFFIPLLLHPQMLASTSEWKRQYLTFHVRSWPTLAHRPNLACHVYLSGSIGIWSFLFVYILSITAFTLQGQYWTATESTWPTKANIYCLPFYKKACLSTLLVALSWGLRNFLSPTVSKLLAISLSHMVITKPIL